MAEQAEMKKTLNLTGVTVNAMALIAPGAFLWLTYQMQAAQVDMAGKTTAMDIFAGLVFALILAFLTAISYAKLAELYPEAGGGSSYYFAERAFLNEPGLASFSRLSKYIVGWFSHLYYWVYPGVMVAMMAVLINYIFGQFGINLSPFTQVLVAVVFSFATGYIAYRGINGSTMSSIVINVIQIVSLVFITVLAIIYRVTNPQHVHFVHKTLASAILPHNFANVMFQATIAILLLVGFESATALSAEAKSPKHISRGVIISLVLQGLIFYLFEYFGANAWINNTYTFTAGKITYTGIAAAAQSGAPIGDMVKILGDCLLGNIGFLLMIIIAISVAIAVLGTTLACMNTGVRVTYAMAKDKEVPSILGMLHNRSRNSAYRSLDHHHCIRVNRRIWGTDNHQFNRDYVFIEHWNLCSLWNDQLNRFGGFLSASPAKPVHSYYCTVPRGYCQCRNVNSGDLLGYSRRRGYPGRGNDVYRRHYSLDSHWNWLPNRQQPGFGS